MKKDDIRAKLDELGIEYNEDASKDELVALLPEGSLDTDKGDDYLISARFRAHHQELNAQVVLKYSGKGKTIEDAFESVALENNDDVPNLATTKFPRINSNVIIKVTHGGKVLERNVAKHKAWAILIDGSVQEFNRVFKF